ncbi:MAG TPA: LamG-like jellyroll fold domain-containing protein, partial [Anaerolineales bacterium]|nr:LamG-like jellyroll fold domain-containing protein [Anaerolineales bacterium]
MEKRKIVGSSVLWILLIFMSLSIRAIGAIDIYVATDGNDGNDGTISAPFATLTKARDTIQAMRPGPIGINGATEVTIAARVYPDAKDSNDGIVSCTGSTYFALLFSGYGVGKPLECRAMGTSLLGPDNSCPVGDWYYVACVWKSGQIHKLYLDGEEVASNPSPPSGTINASSWYLGTDRLISGRYLDGQTEDVYIWDRALSPSEIAGLAATTPVIPSDYEMSYPDLTDFNNATSIEIEQYIPPFSDAINVWLRGGRYPITSTLNLYSFDSGSADKLITYSAYSGEDVILDGSKDVGSSGFTVTSDTKLQTAARGNVYVKTITDPTLISLLENPNAQISFNDIMMHQSRFPNVAFDEVTKYVNDIQIGTQGTPSNPLGAVVGMYMTFNGDWHTELGRIQKARMRGYVSADWLKETLRVHSVATDNKITLMDGAAYGFGNAHVLRAFVDNLLCEIDESGEWYFDDTDDKLYLWPYTTITEDTVVGVWAGPDMFNIVGGKNLRIENMTMQCAGYSENQFVNMDSCSNVIAVGCTFRYSPPGTVAVNILGECRDCGILSCDFYDIDNASRLYGGIANNSSITPGNNFIENCHFTQVYSKSFYGKVSGINGAGNIFRNNLAHNHNGQIITAAGPDHLFEYNEIFNTGVEEGDGGSIYQGASFTSVNTIEHNFWHHIICIPELYERAAIFSDDGDCFDTVTENVFYKAGTAFKMNAGAGHTADGNVTLDCRMSLNTLGTSSSSSISMYNINMDHIDNRTVAKDAHLMKAFPYFGIDGWETTVSSTNWNNHIASFWRNRYPVMNSLFNQWWSDKSMLKYSTFTDTVEYSNYYGISVGSEATVTGTTSLSDLNDFVDPSVMNFKYKEPRPSWAHDIPFEDIGLYVDSYRTTVPVKDNYRKIVKDHWTGTA